MAESRLTSADYGMLVIYFGALIMTGIFSSLRNRGTVGGYFLAGRSANWVIVGASLFASNIGSGHFVGLAGTAAKTGITVAAFELHAVYTLGMLGWLFLPVYKATGVYTLPQYMFVRFGGSRIRIYLAIMSLFLYVFTKISADLFSGALFMQQALPGQANLYVWVTILVVVSALFTITGGLTAVMWTDAIQTAIMIIGAFVLMVLSFIKVGGYEEMKRKFPLALSDTNILNSGNESYPFRECGRIKQGWFNLMLPADDEDLPWSGLVFGLTVSAVWYWCTDQVIVQRVLAAKNLSHGKMGCVMASYLKVLPMWFIVFPGMISRILYPDDVGCNEPELCDEICGREKGCADIAYPLLVVRLMPNGVRGLMLAVMMSALISSLTSVFNSTSTIFTIDVWHRVRRKATDVELMIVGRMAVVILIVISILWIPVVQNAEELYSYIQKMTSYFGAPVCAGFVMAVFWNRTTEFGVFWGLIIGTISGLARGIWETAFIADEPCGMPEETKPSDVVVKKVNFLHFGALDFALTALLVVLLSMMGAPPQPEDYVGKTYTTRNSAYTLRREEIIDQETPAYLQTLLGGKSFEEQPCYIKAGLWLCGVETMVRPETEDAGQQSSSHHQLSRSLYENPKLASIMNANMGMALIFITGYWAFYSL